MQGTHELWAYWCSPAMSTFDSSWLISDLINLLKKISYFRAACRAAPNFYKKFFKCAFKKYRVFFSWLSISFSFSYFFIFIGSWYFWLCLFVPAKSYTTLSIEKLYTQHVLWITLTSHRNLLILSEGLKVFFLTV